jgi:hypothetical protein
MTAPSKSRPSGTAAPGGDRAPGGSTYGFFVPEDGQTHDPRVPPGPPRKDAAAGAEPGSPSEADRPALPVDPGGPVEPAGPQPGSASHASSPTVGRSPRGEAESGALQGVETPDPQTRRTREQRIRERAYQRFEHRGDASGDAAGDWFDAEAEIDAEPTRPGLR